MRVLVVDDSKPIRDRLLERLTQLDGVALAEAVNGGDALRKVRQFDPNVVVLDIRIPGGGGIKVLTSIKKDHPSITVMVMTNYPYAQYRRKCLEQGADFFFDKSTEFDTVVDTIAQLMQTGHVSSVAHHTAAAQLVAAEEALEKAQQRKRDMNVLSLLNRPVRRDEDPTTYSMWEKTFDALPDMVIVLDANHTIIRANRAVEEQVGLPAAELAGKKCFEYLHGTSCPVAGCPYELMGKDHLKHSAEMFSDTLQRWFLITVSPILEGDRLIGAIHIAHDITARRQAAEQIELSELRYRQLFESMRSGFALHEVVCDEQGAPCDYRFLEVNSPFEELTGISADQLIGHTVREVIPSIEEKWIQVYGTVALTGESIQLEEFDSSLGRYYSISAYSPNRGQFATIFTDITEQKTAVEAVRHARDVAENASRVKTQFLANISHELRTPLNAVIGLSELLMDSPLNEEQLDYIQTIHVSGEDLLTIIADLLDLAKVEMGKLSVKREPFDLRLVVDKAMKLLQLFAQQKGLTFTAEVDADVRAMMTGDADRLRQVLVNILNNALKFTDAGFVRLRVHTCTLQGTARGVEFTVEDSGCGMDAETLGRIFSPFQQADNSNTREHGGSGLGLAISRNLVEMMGGEIHVNSRLGEGTVFRFHLQDVASID